MPAPLEVLQHTFGYGSFRGQQEQIINHVMNNGDALVLMPTGGGKSLCFQIPAITKPGVTLVVSPLIALMQDQVNGLRQLGVRAAYVNSSLMPREAHEIESMMTQGLLDLVYVAPERLVQERFLNLLRATHINLFAIDEAHCVSQWGHDFRPEYTQLSVLSQQFPDVPRIALTATADQRTREDIVHQLQLENAEQFISGFDRPNIRYSIVLKDNPKQQLLRFLRAEHPGDAGIVYCLSRAKVEKTAQWLTNEGLPAIPYHAGLNGRTRQYNQDRFINEEGLIVCATVAFGMGIDKPNVRFVAHLDLPKSLEAYYQETGRAGRDGLPANAWMAYGMQDVVLLRQMLDGSNAADHQKRIERHKLDAMLGLAETTACRRQHLLRYFGQDLAEPCGNCDTCLHPVDTWDGTIAAQKALSCVYRTGQRYGAGYVIDVLLGNTKDTRIHNQGHDRLSTFGIGTELTKKEWNGVFRQLIAKDLLRVEPESMGSMTLGPGARAVLRGEEDVAFRHEPKKTREPKRSKADKAKSSNRSKSRSNRISFESQEDAALWEDLRARRLELAQDQGVPPYIIFSDNTLLAMVEHRPGTREELARISGVGDYKLEKYGEDFLDVLNEHIIGLTTHDDDFA